jgi:hypothetical protein
MEYFDGRRNGRECGASRGAPFSTATGFFLESPKVAVYNQPFR